jgi:CcmD family protein
VIRMCRALLCVLLLAMPMVTRAQTPQPPAPATQGFEPMKEVPASEQIPAFRLVAIAYGFVWIMLVGYVWSVSRRLQSVEQELARFDRKGA